MHMYACVCTHTCGCMCVVGRVCIGVRMNTCTHVCVGGCAHVCILHIHRHISTHQHIHMCAHAYAYIRTHTHIYMYTDTHTYEQTRSHTYVYMFMHAYLHMYIHTYMHAHKHACIHTDIRTYIHTQACIHSHTHLTICVYNTWCVTRNTCVYIIGYGQFHLSRWIGCLDWTSDTLISSLRVVRIVCSFSLTRRPSSVSNDTQLRCMPLEQPVRSRHRFMTRSFLTDEDNIHPRLSSTTAVLFGMVIRRLMITMEWSHNDRSCATSLSSCRTQWGPASVPCSNDHRPSPISVWW